MKQKTVCWLVVWGATVPAVHAQSVQLDPQADGGQVLQEVTVTATKTGARSVQEIPLAISAYSAETLEASGAKSLGDIAAFTPGLTFSTNSVWAITSVRGIGTNNVFAGGDPSTTLQVDGVYYGRPTGANLDFMDVERVEVLRGPQGTLYGRNATGGTINVITQGPTSELGGSLKLTAGTYGLLRPEAVLHGPIVEDKLGFSIAAQHSTRDGYIEQLNRALPDQWDEDRSAVRGQLRFTPTDDVTFTLRGDYSRADENFNFPTVRMTAAADDGTTPDFFEASLDHPNHNELEQWGASGTLVWDLGGATLTSITAHRTSDSNLSADLDFTQLALFKTRAFAENQEQFTQEIDLNGRMGRLEYVTGVFFYREQAESFFNANLFNSLYLTQGIDVTTRSYALFAQGSYDLTETLALTVGLRYTRDKKETANTYGAYALDPALLNGGEPADPMTSAPTAVIFAGDADFDDFTPRVGLQYRLSEDALLYASATRGFKSGGYNLLVDPTTTASTGYEPEALWAYEAGLKTSLRGAVPVVINVAAFRYDYEDLQVNQFSFNASGVGQLVSNAPGAAVHGAEVELSAQPGRWLQVGATLAYLEATYDGTFLALNNLSNSSFDANGKTLNDAPEWTGSAYAQTEWSIADLTLGLRAEAQYKGEVFYSPLNDVRLGADSYWLFNLGLRVQPGSGPWEIGVLGRNLGATEYLTANYYSFSSAGQPGEPRTVQLYGRWNF